MNNEVRELQQHFCPFGYLDLQQACKIWDQVWLYESDLFEIIDDFRESCGFWDFEKLDPVYCILEHILQMARNQIEELTGYDFMNDFSGSWSEIYTYGNFMCSSFDYSEDARAELIVKVKPHLQELLNDKWCRYLFSELGIGAE